MCARTVVFSASRDDAGFPSCVSRTTKLFVEEVEMDIYCLTLAIPCRVHAKYSRGATFTEWSHVVADGPSGGQKRPSEDEWEVVDKAETLRDSSYVGPATFADSVASQPASPAPGGDGTSDKNKQSMEAAGVLSGLSGCRGSRTRWFAIC